MKHLSFAIFSALLLTAISCTQPPPPAATQTLLLDLQSPNCSTVEGFPTYENDSIQVAYVFWAENGLVGLFIHNKLKQPLYNRLEKMFIYYGDDKARLLGRNRYHDGKWILSNQCIILGNVLRPRP